MSPIIDPPPPPRKDRISRMFEFFPQNFFMPKIFSEDAAFIAAYHLLYTAQPPTPESLFYAVKNN